MPDLELLRRLAPPVEPAPRRSFTPPRPRRRAPLVLTPIAAGVAALAFAVAQLGGGQSFAEAAIRAAEASPRLLVDGWDVTRVDEWDAGQGEMTFARDGRTLELRWPAERDKGLERVRGDVYRYPGSNDFTAYVGEATVRGTAPSADAFAEAIKRVHRVSAEEWLRALPGSAVTPRARAATVAEMLRGIPLPAGFKPPAAAGETRDRYQLGAHVAGAVACAWIERGGEQAREALATARSWPILLEMNAEGDYPEVLWSYADAVAAHGEVPGGKPGMTVEETYRDALGC